MGKVKHGMFGPVTGKVRNLVYYQRGEENLVRIKGTRDAPLTAEELVNTGKMTGLMKFFKYIKPFLEAGFSNSVKGTNWNYHNMATSYNKVHVDGLTDGLAHLDYASVLLSMGPGLAPQDASFVLDDHTVRFTWEWDPAEWEAGSDQVMMMAYLPDKNYAVYETAGAKRSAGEDQLQMDPSHRQERMEIFISFVSKNRDTVSNSVYLGRIN